MSFYSRSKRRFAWLIRALFRVKLIGAENEPEDGTFLICANHISEADPLILGACLKHNPRYMAKKELMKVPVIGKLITALGAYPIDRGGNDVAAIRKTVDFLKNGESVIMFPQGTRCRGVDPTGTKFRNGCALIAARAGVPVLPIYIGTKNFRVRLFRRVTVKVGKPISCDEITGAETGREDFASGASLVFSRIIATGKDE